VYDALRLRRGACRYDAVLAMSYTFTGKERDSESGLDNFGARLRGLRGTTSRTSRDDFEGQTGRFLIFSCYDSH